MNKITKTRVGDDIHYYANGVEDRGIVAKVGDSFITIFKEDGKFYDVALNDTFHVADILVNKSWNDMTMAERADELVKAKAYTPMFLAKSWEQLPREVRDVLKIKSDLGESTFGNVGGRPNVGVSTQFNIDADEDYEGDSHEPVKEQFKYDEKKPEVSMTGHKKKMGTPGMAAAPTGQKNIPGVNPVYDKTNKITKQPENPLPSEQQQTTKKLVKGIPETVTPKYGMRYLTKEESEKMKDEKL